MGRPSAYKMEHLQRTGKLNSVNYFHADFSKADDVPFLINKDLPPDNLKLFSTENITLPPSLS